MSDIKFNRYWEMPNSNTFDIKCIKTFINNYINEINIKTNNNYISIDPFANKNRIAKITNDIDPEMLCDYNLDAKIFLKLFDDQSIDIVLFDPPYSPRQVSECYKKMGLSVNKEMTQSSFWSKLKNEIQRIIKPNGIVLSFGWNSCGIGKTRGFELIEQLNVCHGGNHNDTICVSERKIL